MLLAVFDIDGVLANVTHRLHHLGTEPKDWEAFFAAAAQDPLLPEGAELIGTLAADHEILYLTGRPERTRALTARWLRQHQLPDAELWMRPDGDHRPARLFKRESIRRLLASRNVDIVIDDDPQVIALLAAEGVPTRLAAWLPYAEPLAAAQEKHGRT